MQVTVVLWPKNATTSLAPIRRCASRRRISAQPWATRVIAGLIVLFLAGCATYSGRQYDKRIARTKAALITAGDPDSLAAAAFLTLKDGSAMRLALLSRAAEGAPERADLTWLQLQACRQVNSCDPEPIAAHLRTIDPANGIGWLERIAEDSESSRETPLRASVLAMPNSQRFDIYWNPIIVNTTRAILKTQTMDSLQALVSMLGMVAAQAIPAYQSITRECQGVLLADGDVLAACRRVSAVLRHGDTYISEMVGLSIAKRVWPEGSPEYQDAVNTRRVLRYRLDMMTLRVSSRRELDSAHAAQYLELLATHRTEQEVVLAEIVNAGIDPNPPADWKDKWPSP